MNIEEEFLVHLSMENFSYIVRVVSNNTEMETRCPENTVKARYNYGYLALIQGC